MRRTIRSILCSISLLAFVPYVAPAQVQTGTPPFGSFGGGPDTINLANLNSHIVIPVLHKPGRGTNFTYDLSYDSLVWLPRSSSGTNTWTPIYNWGWRAVTEIASGYISFLQEGPGQCSGINGERELGRWGYTNWVYHDPFGVPHPFSGTITVITGRCYPHSGGSLLVTATDGSGYTLNASANSGVQASIITRDGKTITPPLNTGSSSSTSTDRNGNQIIVSSAGVFTDTLGTTALTVAGSGTPTGPTTFTYTAPSGASTAYTMSYKTYTLKTNFGCSNIAEYGPTSINLVDRVTLPDGSFYQFNYEPTPGFPSDYTGRLASVTLPTGGTISYTYTGGNNGVICADGSTAGLTRQTPDGSWTYTRSIGSGAASTTTITDPQGNVSVLQFQGIYETQRQVYQGSTTLLLTTNTCYNAAVSPCNGSAITLPITQRAVITTLPNNLQSKHVESYSTYGVPTETDDYDYASGAPGTLFRKTTITYASLGNITAFRQTVTVYNGAGTQVAKTNFNYDETAVTATSGTPQHVSVSGSRGNLTSINYPVSGLTAHSTYYDTGTMNAATDVNGAVTTNSYAGSSCGNSFPTSITEPLSMSRSMAWNCTGGVQTSVTDENGKVTSTVWTDPDFWRPAATNFPDGGQTSITYNSATSVTATTKMNSTQNIVGTVLLDGLGRTKQTQLADPQGMDYVDTTYDSLGRVASVSNPHRSSGSNTDGTTAYGYDALNRTTSVNLQDGSVASVSYSGNTATATDPAGKKRQSTYDSLGRLTQVVEDPGAGGLGYTSTYTYDALGNLTNVMQNGSRQRTYGYDGLSRLTSETNPESGTKTYAYDSDSTMCGNGPYTSNGDLVKTSDAAGNCVLRYYDSLHRLTDVGTSSASGCKRFRYDNTTGVTGSIPAGVSVSNVIGRLTEAETDNCSWPITQSSIITDRWFSYDSMGRVSLDAQRPPMALAAGTPFLLNYAYDLAGNMTSKGTGNGGVTFSQSFDTAGRVTQLASSFVDAQHPSPLATVDPSVGFYPNGAIGKITYGNGLTEANVSEARLQPCVMNVNSTGKAPSDIGGCVGINNPPAGTVQQVGFAYGVWGSSNNGNVTTMIAAGAQSYNRTYGYDQLNRLSTMTDAATSQACRGLSWTYDAWGNRTDQTQTAGSCGEFHASANPQNQIVDLVNHIYQYDADGELTADGSHTYTYDSDNRLLKVDGGNTATYTYDALGHRVQKTIGSAPTSYVYDLSGNVVAEVNNVCASICWAVFYANLNGQPIAEYKNLTTYFFHGDHLGSTRLVTGVNQAVVQNLDYLPFGELNSTDSGISTHKFTGDERDSETSLDHTQFRQYTSQLARWISPDPAGLAAVDPTNPQSWNRYAYVLNNPLKFIDPTGLECVWDDGSYDSLDDTVTGTPGGCGDQGGTWIDHSFFSDFGLPDWSGAPVGDLSTIASALQNGLSLVQTGQGINGWQLQQSSGGSLLWTIFNAFWAQVPWSVTAVEPLVDFGPNASGGVGLTMAYNPKSNKTCVGLAGGAQFPAAGRAVAGGPLVLGNLNNADAVLSGGSVNAGVQSVSPVIGAQMMANSSGWLGGPTAGTPGIFSGVSVSGCSTKITNFLSQAISNLDGALP